MTDDDEDSYATLLEIVAENPASTADEIAELAVERGVDENAARDLLATAVANGDVMEADAKHWIVRKGKFAFHEYDHPKPSDS